MVWRHYKKISFTVGSAPSDASDASLGGTLISTVVLHPENKNTLK